MKDFKNQVVWITGASSGIGEALCQAFAKEGAKIILSSRREAELRRVAEACTGAADTFILPLDLAQSDTLPEKVKVALDHFGHIDLLINNGGISQRSLAKDTNMQVYRQIMEVDYFGTVALTQALLPHMLKRGSGHLSVVSSIAGKLGVPLRTAYSGAKFAVNGYFEALRVETLQAGLKVSIICPGSINTNVSKNALTGDGSAQGATDNSIANGVAPEECARQILEGLKAEELEILIGNEMELGAVQLRQSDHNQLNQMLQQYLQDYKLQD